MGTHFGTAVFSEETFSVCSTCGRNPRRNFAFQHQGKREKVSKLAIAENNPTIEKYYEKIYHISSYFIILSYEEDHPVSHTMQRTCQDPNFNSNPHFSCTMG